MKNVLLIVFVFLSVNAIASNEGDKESLSYWELLKAKASIENIEEHLRQGKDKVKEKWEEHNLSEKLDNKVYDIAQKIDLTKRENQVVGAIERNLPNIEIVKSATMTIRASSDLLRATIVTDKEMRIMAGKSIEKLDKDNTLALDSNKYTLRLKKIIKNLKTPRQVTLDLKVYIDKSVNAFALANGSVRIYSGLMDKLDDDELLFVIGHELGHVKNKDSKDSYRMAYLVSGLRKGAVAQGGLTGSIANGVIGKLTSDLVNAKFSRHEEREADKYGVTFLKINGLSKKVAVASLQKLESSDSNLLSSHPSSKDRIEEIKERVKGL